MRVNKWLFGGGIGTIVAGLAMVLGGWAVARQKRAVRPTIRMNGELVPMGDDVVANRPA